MASRMERYYNAEERSKKNRSLYNQISNLENYTNIEGVLDISNSNEISMSAVKKLINNDNPKKVSVKKVQEVQSEEISNEEKNYDLKDVLKKAKHGHSDSDLRHRKIRLQQYEILKKLKEEQPDNEKIDGLLTTIALSTTSGDDLGIFDDLKSNTMIGEEASAIKDILDEAREEESSKEYSEFETETEISTNPNENLDKSFYTSSFNFSDKDFDDLKKLDSTLKKNNKLIKILIILFSITLAIILLIVLAKLIFY